VVTRSLDQGRVAGLVSVLGVETGTFAYAAAAAAGLSGLIAASLTAFTAVKVAGAAYLIYLGLRTLLRRDGQGDAAAGVHSRLYLNGLLVQLLNPKIALFFVAFLPQFTAAGRGPVAAQVLALGCLFTLLAVLSDGGYALLAGVLGDRLRSGRGRRWLTRVSGGVYLGLGVGAALSGSGPARPSHR
jgi:threonine/homoserine/homoserine lactone efflux protein